VPQTDQQAVAASSVAVRCSRIVKHYRAPSGETQALRGVEAEFASGTVTAVTGPSGSGKSSLLSIVALQERPTGGELEICGISVAGLSLRNLAALRVQSVAWVAQRPGDSLFPQLTAREQLLQTASWARGIPGAALATLDRLGLTDRGEALVGELSGGEQQRLALGAAVAAGRPVVVADEPTAELDDESAALVLTELARCAAAGAAVLVSTHDERVTARADRVLALRHGVLSTERELGGVSVAPIDSAGRIQLPREALGLFPTGRAVVDIDGDQVVLRPPTGSADP
jgi:putative ABC transport system ATP-binding protein